MREKGERSHKPYKEKAIKLTRKTHIKERKRINEEQ